MPPRSRVTGALAKFHGGRYFRKVTYTKRCAQCVEAAAVLCVGIRNRPHFVAQRHVAGDCKDVGPGRDGLMECGLRV
eukprot:scaffold2450_cov401-Prasinococcus_capsulatus_cf.AAC.9